MLEYIVLGMVFNEALTGYDIKKYIENGIGVFYKASYGSLYPLLKRLTHKGYLTMKEDYQGDRQKKYYQITDEGKQVFSEWLKTPVNLNDNTDNRLVKVYFFDQLPDKVSKQLLNEYEENNRFLLRKLKVLQEKFEKTDNMDCYYYKLSTLYYGICIVKENIRWCRHIRDKKPLLNLIIKEEEEWDK